MQPEQPQNNNPNEQFGSPTLPPAPAPGPQSKTPGSGPQVFGPATTSVGPPPQTGAPIAGGANPQKAKKKGPIKAFVIALVALLFVGGGVAAAYYGYYLPNTPENKLKLALLNFADQPQITAKTKIDVVDKNEGGTSIAIDANISSNSDTGQARVEGTIGASGAQIPYDVRLIDQDIYAKVSGLEFLATLTAGTEYSPLTAGLEKVNDQWYVIDRSFTNEIASEGCSFDAIFNISNEEQDKIVDAYNKYPLFIVKSTSSEEVAGESVTKIEAEPTSDQEANNFVGELKDLSVYSQLNSCFSSSTGDQEVSGDQEVQLEAQGKVYFYVNSSKEIKKITLEGSDESSQFTASADISYTAEPIEVPEGARPIQELLGDILGQALGGATGETSLDSLTL